jgi:hypothetical protein
MNDHQRDLEHLRLLSVFHYVVAALAALFSMFPLIHLGIGIAMVSGTFDGGKEPPPGFVGWMLIAFAGSFILAGLTIAVLIALAGRSLARRRRYTFCCVMAGVACVFMPFGTALGVFTLIVLLRPGVRELFEPQTA